MSTAQIFHDSRKNRIKLSWEGWNTFSIIHSAVSPSRFHSLTTTSVVPWNSALGMIYCCMIVWPTTQSKVKHVIKVQIICPATEHSSIWPCLLSTHNNTSVQHYHAEHFSDTLHSLHCKETGPIKRNRTLSKPSLIPPLPNLLSHTLSPALLPSHVTGSVPKQIVLVKSQFLFKHCDMNSVNTHFSCYHISSCLQWKGLSPGWKCSQLRLWKVAQSLRTGSWKDRHRRNLHLNKLFNVKMELRIEYIFAN